jgi:hypothetical protein
MIQGSAHVRETMPSAKKPASAMGKKAKRNWYELNNTGEITSLHGGVGADLPLGRGQFTRKECFRIAFRRPAFHASYSSQSEKKFRVEPLLAVLRSKM